MRGTAIATLGVVGLLVGAGSVPAQAQSGSRLTAARAEQRVTNHVTNLGGQGIDTSCRRARGGKVRCTVTYTSADGRLCSDRRVTVIRRRGRLQVRGLNARCAAPAPQAAPALPGVTPPPTIPSPGAATGPIYDPGSAAPVGPPPGVPGGPIAPPPGAPQATATASATGGPVARAAQSGFVGCTPWQVDPWYGGWWIYACFWSYSSAPPGAHLIGWQTSYVGQVYYWNGSQAAFWFRWEWTA